MRTGRAVGFVAAAVAVIMSASVVGARACEQSVSIHSPGTVQSDNGYDYYGRFASADGVMIMGLAMTLDGFPPCSTRTGTLYWQLGKLSGPAFVQGTGTFSFKPAPSLLGSCDLGTLTLTLTGTGTTVGGGTFSGFGSSNQRQFAGSLDLEVYEAVA